MRLSKEPSNLFTGWTPLAGWLFLLPSRSNNKVGGILLPDSATKETNQGICFKTEGEVYFMYMDMECYFPQHSQYTVKDSDTGYEFYVVEVSKIIMMRVPPDDVLAFSRKQQGDDSFRFVTTEHSKKN